MASGADTVLDEDELRARSIDVIGLTSAPSPAQTRALIVDALDHRESRGSRVVSTEPGPSRFVLPAHRAVF